MTVAEFFGSSFIAFGPALAMFCLTIAVDPIRVIILVASAFFWLLSLLITAIIWILLPISQHLVVGAVFSVIFQELFRFIAYKLIRRAENGLQCITENGKELVDNKHILAYVAGLGFGLMSGLFALMNVLADIVGPATVGLRGTQQDFVMESAALTLCFTLLHVFWSVIFFAALDNKNYIHLGWVIASHFLASGCSFFNSNQLFAASFVPCVALVIVNAVVAFRVAGGTLTSLKLSLKC